MIRAIIDIGTNTAHILIAEVADGSIIRVIHKERHYTFLGEGGLDKISKDAIKRLSDALDLFKLSIESYRCDHVRVLATEGLRSAENGHQIYQRIEHTYGWPMQIISGIKESEYIYRGANQSCELSDDAALIMDIGGGSIEFIYLIDGKIRLQKSYPIGISRLYEEYQISEPISLAEKKDIIDHLNITLSEMWDTIPLSPPPVLIGCAGTFEIFLSEEELNRKSISSAYIDTSKVKDLLSQVEAKDMSQRQLVQGLPSERAKYIVVALLLISYVIERLEIDAFIVSKYALKEGAIIDDKLFLD